MINLPDNILRKPGKWFSILQNIDETGNNCLKKCALSYMAAKVFLILLATGSITILFLLPAFQQFVEDTSRLKVLIFTTPVILVILFKLYFIGVVLLTYDRSKLILQSLIKNILSEGQKVVLKLRELVPIGFRHAQGKYARYR
ncbi:MAG: hypothetical protein FJ264_03265 [Planctomycetes bacterium]|nr:hypothetical protein [Planctomycetota bacterium]